MHPRPSPAVLVLLAASIGACAPAATARPAPAPVDHASHDTPAVAAAPAPQLPAGAKHSPADARFMEHMIHHHAQALEMVALIPARTTRADLRLLGERIAVSQQDEIAQMQRWLRVRGHAAPDVSAHHGSHEAAGMPGMPGMATRAELERLAAARGVAFERLFLELMIRHHEGAIVMVRQLFSSPGAAQETETWSIASEVDADQQMEIDRMRILLASLPSASAAP